MAPFGATCVLLFSVPNSPLSQPANVIGGHLVSTAIGLLLHAMLPVEWWSLGLAVGLAIAAMAVLRVTHPPAGADPLVVFFDSPGWAYPGLPVAFGSPAMRCSGRVPVQISGTGSALSYGLWRGRQSVQAGSALDASDSLSRV